MQSTLDLIMPSPNCPRSTQNSRSSPNNEGLSLQAAEIAKASGISTLLSISLVSSKLKSLSGAPSLTGADGNLKNAPNVSQWDFSVIDTYTPEDIELEIAAQYQWFLDTMGHKPSAIVTQKGEHGDPKILEPMIRLAKKKASPMRAPLWQWQANYGAQSLVESEGIKTTSQFFVGFKDWQNGAGYDLETDYEVLCAKINAVHGVSELAVFTGFCDADLIDMTSVSWQRGQLLNILKRKYHLIERLYREFDVITYSDL